MSGEEVRVLSDIRERVVRLETKIDAIAEVRESAEEGRDTANQALQSAKSAHKRLDKIESNQTWLWRTVAGAIILGAIGSLIKFGG